MDGVHCAVLRCTHGMVWGTAMRDQRDPGILGAEIIRLVEAGWKPVVAAATVCPSLPRPATGQALSASELAGMEAHSPGADGPERPGGDGS